MASGSQNMTTYNARIVTGSNSAASPAGALLLSGAGRADDATGDTWIFLDSAGGTTNPWGIKHDQTNNKLQIFGSGTNSVSVRMNTGDTYILGKVGIGYDPETSGNTYKLYVEGSTRINSTLHIFPNSANYTEGVRIHSYNSWSDITLCGNDNTGDSGISANSWFIGNNNGNFYIARNGSPGSTAYIGCVSNVWKFVTAADIPEGAANLSGAATAHTLSIYRNGITIPYQMDNANDGGMFRVRGTSESTCIAEIGTWDDSGAGETIQFNYYPTTSQITPTYSVSVPKTSGTISVTGGSVSGSTHAAALQAYFNSYKASEPRNALVAHYSSAYGNGSLCMGYFLSGYDSNPYGGFFVCHYNNPYYVGISNGTYTQQHILTSTNYTSYTVTKTGSGASGSWGISVTGSSGSCTGNAASATKLQTARSLWGNSFNGTGDITGAINCSDIRGGNVRLTSNWVGFYQKANAGGSRYGYIQCNADRMYFRKENGVSTYHFDMNGGYLLTSRCYNAVWNDYAECRQVETEEPGRCVTESKSGTMIITTKRLQAGCKVISDTYGTCIGATNLVKTPIAVSGRVLAYPYRNRTEYPLGAAVCSAPNGTVDIMSRDEIMMYPERIVGTVSEIPDYEIWHAGSNELPEDIDVNGRIWIYVR